MRSEVWQFSTNRRVATFARKAAALRYVRERYDPTDPAAVNDLGLLPCGAGATLTYPLEGPALIARAFGLEEGA